MVKNAPRVTSVSVVFKNAFARTMLHVTLNQAPAIVSLGGMGLIARGHVLMDIGKYLISIKL